VRVSIRSQEEIDHSDLGAQPLLLTTAGRKAAAALGLGGSAPFLQPVDGAPVFLNGHRLAAAQWLRDGDRLEVGGVAASVQFNGDLLTLQTDGDLAFAREAPAITLAPPPPAPVPRQKRVGKTFVLAALAVLAIALWFVFSARMLYVDVKPEPERVQLAGRIPAVRLADGYLALPGPYRLRAERAGYRTFEREIEITRADNQRIAVVMEKMPGYLTVETAGIEGATVSFGDKILGKTPLKDVEVPAGEHQVTVRADGYADFSTAIRMDGEGRRQTLAAALIPASATIAIQSTTPGATLYVDGTRKGPLPMSLDLGAGTRMIEIRADAHKTWRRSLPVVAGQSQQIGPVALAPADGELRVESEPAGASIAVDGRFVGTTPATLMLAPARDHRVTISKGGHATASRTVHLKSAEKQALRVGLTADTGPVTLRVEPPDALLRIEGRPVGTANGRHELPAAPTLLEIVREGYETAQVWVTPKPGFEQSRTIRLRVPGAPAASALPEKITAPDGTVMILVRPGKFTMGASRRDPGQRANETLRDVTLTRPYYLGATEVTNAQFGKYRPQHRSGRFGSASLEVPSHPVVNVRWEDAAGYCNWLNDAAQLPPAYAGTSGALTPVLPLKHGFRLPTEAEWAWAARHAGVKEARRFAWGDSLPPPPGSGNFADRSISGELADAFRDYDDGYPTTAPVGRFKPSPAGFFDLAGNVAEWVQNYYAIVSGPQEADPAGPAAGKLHVIRGSSWMQAGVSALRWTYRDYGSEPRPDVGFRCARYATETP